MKFPLGAKTGALCDGQCGGVGDFLISPKIFWSLDGKLLKIILEMVSVAEFQTGQFSIPAADLEEIPECCLTCVYLSYKEFSTSEGALFYYCAYLWSDRTAKPPPACSEKPF